MSEMEEKLSNVLNNPQMMQLKSTTIWDLWAR